ncbi:MAG: PEGA domain-containing protein [Deltaproteobacteria bacterium]|nr:PEGA domain-containing protein [Deltaproteobacteria bacterium]
MRLRTAALVLALSCAFVARVHAQVPACEGDDAALAARSLEEGDRAADRAVLALQRRHAEEATAAWTDALTAYDRACAAGEDQALERRAIPLFRLGRVAEAASSLDTFLDDHPVEQLEPAIARRVATNLRAIERRVATLVILTTPETATVIVDGRTVGTGPARVRVAAETNVTVVVRAPGYTRFRLSSTYSAGEHEVRADLLASEELAPETEEDDALPQPPILIDPAGQVPVLAVYAAPRRNIPGFLIGGILGTVFGAGALVIGSIGTHFWATDDYDWFNNPGSAGILGVSLLGAGAVIVGVTIWFFYEHATHAERSHSNTLRCAPGLASLGCVAYF